LGKSFFGKFGNELAGSCKRKSTGENLEKSFFGKFGN
jgi:hypothetical protein